MTKSITAPVRALALAVLLTASLPAQSVSHKIDLPEDSPVVLLSANFDNSTAAARGGAYLVDVHAALSLRNAGQKPIRGVTLSVSAQQVAPGGEGSVAVPSLNVDPGGAFSVRIDMRLLRPLSARPGGPGVEVKLDGVLFDDLSFFGPDVLHSRRSMTLWELEARRDREYFKSLLAGGGAERLRQEMQALASQPSQRGPGVQMVRGRATNIDAERQVQFAFLDIPEAPVEALAGTASVSDEEAHAPQFRIRNRSGRPVEHLEIGWIVRDQQGRAFLAASMPADLKLAPNQSGQVRKDAALRFQSPVSLDDMSGFVSSVEFSDGAFWIPSRDALAAPGLRDVVPPSPEQQRLLQIYNRKGLGDLIEELDKF